MSKRNRKPYIITAGRNVRGERVFHVQDRKTRNTVIGGFAFEKRADARKLRDHLTALAHLDRILLRVT